VACRHIGSVLKLTSIRMIHIQHTKLETHENSFLNFFSNHLKENTFEFFCLIRTHKRFLHEKLWMKYKKSFILIKR
jgi:hypothetical protein